MKAKKSTPYVFLLPLLIAFGLFLLYPLGKVVWDSFYKFSFLNPSHKIWVGGSNYSWLFSFKLYNPVYSYFVGALLRTILWVGGSVGLKISLGLGGALLLNSEFLKGKKFYRTLLIIPWSIPWAMSAMIWYWTLNGQFGLINSILLHLHIISEPVAFLGYPTTAFISTFIVDAWIGLPFMVIMLLSGLQTIPKHLYEAATIDGAGDFIKFTKITLPMIKPVLLTISLLSLVWTFNSFAPIWILTRGGPVTSTTTLPIAIYNTSFRYLTFGGVGKASAMTIFQVLLVTSVSLIYIKTLKGEES
ncbi:carbohydrate ABC transporter permease [Mesoaciditoga lauensis]|uniref:carbohydrate ABC transporter permease n=1 Tax=Mesoaciditoga lauensis TaxID=1495039 RepID=UPI000689E241|nr:sugar ABC transporter permease [Mesoaciditoga lauensis]